MRPACLGSALRRRKTMLKIHGCNAAIIIIIGLLVVFGVLKLIF